MEIRKILVPVDFSDDSRSAFDQAIALARHFDAELTLYHCYPIPIPSIGRVPFGSVAPQQYVEAVRSAALEEVTRWRDQARARGVRAEGPIGAGSPANEITALGQKIGADWIVMGTRGRSGLAHVMLGSVAERTIRTASCPVLVVKAR